MKEKNPDWQNDKCTPPTMLVIIRWPKQKNIHCKPRAAKKSPALQMSIWQIEVSVNTFQRKKFPLHNKIDVFLCQNNAKKKYKFHLVFKKIAKSLWKNTHFSNCDHDSIQIQHNYGKIAPKYRFILAPLIKIQEVQNH